MSGEDTEGAREACKASVIGIRQDQQVCQSILPQGQAEVRGTVDAAAIKASSVPTVTVMFDALKKVILE